MAVVGQETRKVPIPHEPGEWMRLRTVLSPYEVDRSRQQGGFHLLGSIEETVGAESVRGIMEALDSGKSPEEVHKALPPGEKAEEEPEEPETDVADGPVIGTIGDGGDIDEPDEASVPVPQRMGAYDMHTAARRLIVAWSYRTANGGKLKVSLRNVRDLDRPTWAWLEPLVWEAMQPSLPLTEDRLGE